MTVLFLVASSYFATNIDNLLLLVGWMLGGRVSTGRLFAAYAIAAIAVLIASVALGLSASVIPTNYVGYLGFVPILLGVKLFVEQVRHRGNTPASETLGTFSVAAIAATLFSNSVDTMLVFAPLLADSNAGTDRVIAAAYLVMAFSWFFAAQFFGQRASRLRRISTAAQWLTPLIMIAIGLYILDNTLTDVVPGS